MNFNKIRGLLQGDPEINGGGADSSQSRMASAAKAVYGDTSESQQHQRQSESDDDDDDLSDIPDNEYDPLIHDRPEFRTQRKLAKQQQSPTGQLPIPIPDLSNLGKQIAEGLREVVQPQQQQKQQFTLDDFRRTAGWTEPSLEMVEALFNPDATAEQRLGVLKQLLTGAQSFAQNVALALHKDLHGNFTQFQTEYTERERKAAVLGECDRVTKAYPALEPYKAHLPQIFEALRQSGFRPQTQEEGVLALASFAQRTIKQFNPNFSLKPKREAPASGRNMPTGLNGGGRSSAGGKGASVPAWKQVYGV